MTIETQPTDTPLDPAAPTSPDTSTAPVDTSSATELTDATDAPAATEPAPTEPTEAPTLVYDGVEVEISVDPELNEMFTGKGLNANDVANELYSGDEFGLSDETKGKLYEAFGKFAVDSYLNGLKAQNDNRMREIKETENARSAASEAAWKEALEITGGDEGYAAMEAWADANFTDQEYAEYNEIMEGNNWTMQRLALQDLAQRSKAGNGDAPSSLHPNQVNNSMTGNSLELIEMQGNDSRGGSDNTPLTNQQYNALYLKTDDPAALAQLDARRRAGIAKGI